MNGVTRVVPGKHAAPAAAGLDKPFDPSRGLG